MYIIKKYLLSGVMCGVMPPHDKGFKGSIPLPTRQKVLKEEFIINMLVLVLV